MPFILSTVNNYDEYGLVVSAQKVFEERISSNQWFIYEGTRNRKTLETGAKILFYLSGRKLIPQIVAKAEISCIRKPKHGEVTTDVNKTVHSVLEFKNFERFDKPVDFKNALSSLTFAPKNMKKWGVVVLGGCRKISDQDYNLILDIEKQCR